MIKCNRMENNFPSVAGYAIEREIPRRKNRNKAQAAYPLPTQKNCLERFIPSLFCIHP